MFKSRVLAGSVFVLLAASSLHAGVLPLSEGFDNISTLAGSGWVMVNNSSPLGSTGWFQGNTGVFTAQAGAPDSYIAANFNNADSLLGGSIDNWLMTPAFSVQSNWLEFDFFTRTVPGSVYPDRLEVWLSTNGASSNVSDFSPLLTVNPTLSVGGYPEDWAYYSVTISGASVPANGRFAFRYDVPDNINDANYIGIDSVLLSDVPEPATLGLIVFGLGAALLRRRFCRGNQV
jgi:hypothetical protein